jgi:hypothetical protein
MATILFSGIELQPRLAHLDADGPHCVEVELCFMTEAHDRHANG